MYNVRWVGDSVREELRHDRHSERKSNKVNALALMGCPIPFVYKAT